MNVYSMNVLATTDKCHVGNPTPYELWKPFEPIEYIDVQWFNTDKKTETEKEVRNPRQTIIRTLNKGENDWK